MTILRKQSEVLDASMADLVETYNSMCDHLGKKPIKKFESIEVGRVRVTNALMAAQDADAHSGVPKNSTPKPITSDELAAKTGKPTDKASPPSETHATGAEAESGDVSPSPTPKEPTVATKKTPAKKTPAAPAKKAATPAKKTPAAPAKKTPAAPAKKAPAAPRSSTYSWVKLGEPSIPRRPQEGSQRTAVLNQLRTHVDAKGRGVPVSLDQLSKECGFNVRPYVHKLVATEWAEVVSAPKDAQK